MIGDARFARMNIGAAEIFRRDDFAGRRLDERRPRQKDRALPGDDDRLIAHRRDIGAARRAASHHHRNLRNAQSRHPRLIVKNAAEMIAIGKHFVLAWQMGAAAIDEIDARQIVLLRDFLGAKMFFDGQRIIGAALDGGVIGDDDAFLTADASDARDQPRCWNRVRRRPHRRQIAKIRETACPDRSSAAIRSRGNKFSARNMFFARLGAAALRDERDLAAHIFDEALHRGFVRGEILTLRRDGGFENSHRFRSSLPFKVIHSAGMKR